MKERHSFQVYLKGGIAVALTLLLSLNASISFSQQVTIDLGRSESGVSISKDNIHQLALTFSYSSISTIGVETSKGLFSELVIPETFWAGDLGSPKLPASKKLIEVPFGTGVQVKVLKYSVQEYKLEDYGIIDKIIPLQPSVRKDQNITDLNFEYDKSIYEKDSFIEHAIASLEILGVMRGYRIARLTVAPVSYNPHQNLVRIYNDIEVEITFSNVDVELNRIIKASSLSPYFEPLQNSLANNPGSHFLPPENMVKHPVSYLVVADRMFENTLQPFIEWKTKKGFRMITGYTDEIGTSYNEIKNWIHSQYNLATPDHPAPSFLLLVGDTQLIPAATGLATGKVTDLHYASVDGDFFPEMLYGRFSASNPEQLMAQIEKTLYYEQYQFSDPTFLDKTTLIAGADAYWNPRVGQPTLQYGTNNYFNAPKGYTDIHTYLTSPYSGCYDPEKIAVGFINYTAHCNQTMWGNPALTQPLVNGFTNQGQYPLAIGNCCLSADFGFSESIGETWVRAMNKGAVAYIGSAPNSYWFEDFYWSVGAFPIQGNNNGYIPSFEETTTGAYDAPFLNAYITTAGLMFAGNLAVTTANLQGYPGHSSPKYYWQAYNVLGDPSLVIYYTQGKNNIINHQPVFTMGLNYFVIEAEPGSYVAISKEGELHGTALIDSSGIVEVIVQPVLSDGLVDIVVTKPQSIPYQASIPVVATETPYVVAESVIINDAEGNNNGMADYGENISIDVILKNVGLASSGEITITLSGTDDFVFLTSAETIHAAAIASWESLILENVFSFSLTDFVPDQHKADFLLSISDGSHNWNSPLSITVHAPVLSLSPGFEIDDALTGNNNGVLDPGESAVFRFNVMNSGHSDIFQTGILVFTDDVFLTLNNTSALIEQLGAGEMVEISFDISASELTPDAYSANIVISAQGGTQQLYSAIKSATLLIGTMPAYHMENSSMTICPGIFYDSGGPDGNYLNNENLVMTFFPANQEATITAGFLAFETEALYDRLYVYNGPDIFSPQFSGSPFHGNNSPGFLMASNTSGAITFRFVSDGFVSRSGWKAEINCYLPSEPPVCASNPKPSNHATDVSVTTALSWFSNEANTFDVYFSPAGNPTFSGTINENSFSPELLPNTTYFWKVVPKNIFGSAGNCNVWTFTTGDPAYRISNTALNVNSGMFCDSGGPDTDYQDNEDLTITFSPFKAGYKLEFDFLEFDTEYNNDLLFVYDGPDVNAPQIEGSPFSGITNPGVITSSDLSGAITFRFVSNSDFNRPGWKASFRNIGDLAVFPGSYPQSLCEGSAVQLYANAIGGSGNYTFLWEPGTGLNDPLSPNPVANPFSSTFYTLTVNDGEAIASAGFNLVVNPAPLVHLGNDTVLCLENKLLLDASIPGGVSYYWLPDGQTTPTIWVGSDQTGAGQRIFTVFVTDINGCVGEASIQITFDACTYAGDESFEPEIRVFPNPAKALVNLSITAYTGELSCELINHLGQVVYSQNLVNINGSLTHQINTQQYAKGFYFLRLYSPNGILTRKIVLQ